MEVTKKELMENYNKIFNYIIAISVALTVGIVLGKSKAQTKVITKTETVEVVKYKESKNVVENTEEIIRPDGTKITKTTKTDLSVVTNDSDKASKTQTTIDYKKPQWKFGLSGGATYSNGTLIPVYAAVVEKRLSGPIFITGTIMSTGALIGASVEF